VVGYVVVPLVEEIRNGTLFFADPEGIRRGEVELHHWLHAVAKVGTITDKRTMKELTKGIPEERVRVALDRARMELEAVAKELPGKAIELFVATKKDWIIERVALSILGLLK